MQSLTADKSCQTAWICLCNSVFYPKSHRCFSHSLARYLCSLNYLTLHTQEEELREAFKLSHNKSKVSCWFSNIFLFCQQRASQAISVRYFWSLTNILTQQIYSCLAKVLSWGSSCRFTLVESLPCCASQIKTDFFVCSSFVALGGENPQKYTPHPTL